MRYRRKDVADRRQEITADDELEHVFWKYYNGSITDDALDHDALSHGGICS